MSVEALAVVLHHSRAKGTAKLVLIGIANHEGDGGSWPAVGTLAVYANVSRSNVQRALLALETLGEVHRSTQDGGTRSTPDWDRPNLYRVLVMCPPNCDRTTAHRLLCEVCGKQLNRDRRDLKTHTDCDPALPVGPRPASRAGGALPVGPEPSLNPTTTTRFIENDSVSNRASAKDEDKNDDSVAAWTESLGGFLLATCPARTSGAPHAYSIRTDKCIDCGHRNEGTKND